MPHRDRATVESWVAEWFTAHPDNPLRITVLDENYEAGPNSAVVVVSLRTASTLTYLRAVIRQAAPKWVTSFEPRSELLELCTEDMHALAADVAALVDLQEFLQAKTHGLPSLAS